MDDSQHLKSTIGKALGRIPSGVFILTVGDSVAMLASWVQQCGFSPPALSVAVAKDRPAATLLRDSQHFALSILGEKDTPLMKKYARGIKPGEDPFANIATLRTPAGQTALADSLAWLECRLLTTCDFQDDHLLFIAQVTAGALLKEGPSFTHLRGNGLHY